MPHSSEIEFHLQLFSSDYNTVGSGTCSFLALVVAMLFKKAVTIKYIKLRFFSGRGGNWSHITTHLVLLLLVRVNVLKAKGSVVSNRIRTKLAGLFLK